MPSEPAIPQRAAPHQVLVLIPTPPVALIRNWLGPVEDKKGVVVVVSDHTNVPA
jgi:hypothetical protein